MKKSISSARAMMFGGMLAAAFGCEGMTLKDGMKLLENSGIHGQFNNGGVSSMIYEAYYRSLSQPGMTYSPKYYDDATTQLKSGHPAFPPDTTFLVSLVARAGKPWLLMSMGYIPTAEDLVNLFFATEIHHYPADYYPCLWGVRFMDAWDSYDYYYYRALSRIATAVVINYGIDAVRNARGDNGLTLEETSHKYPSEAVLADALAAAKYRIRHP